MENKSRNMLAAAFTVAMLPITFIVTAAGLLLLLWAIAEVSVFLMGIV